VQVRWARLLTTIEAHRIISRARARAHLVAGDTLVKVLARAGLAERRAQASNKYSELGVLDDGHGLSVLADAEADAGAGDYDSDDEENKLTAEEADLMADVKVAALSQGATLHEASVCSAVSSGGCCAQTCAPSCLRVGVVSGVTSSLAGQVPRLGRRAPALHRGAPQGRRLRLVHPPPPPHQKH